MGRAGDQDVILIPLISGSRPAIGCTLQQDLVGLTDHWAIGQHVVTWLLDDLRRTYSRMKGAEKCQIVNNNNSNNNGAQSYTQNNHQGKTYVA